MKEKVLMMQQKPATQHSDYGWVTQQLKQFSVYAADLHSAHHIFPEPSSDSRHVRSSQTHPSCLPCTRSSRMKVRLSFLSSSHPYQGEEMPKSKVSPFPKLTFELKKIYLKPVLATTCISQVVLTPPSTNTPLQRDDITPVKPVQLTAAVTFALCHMS